MFQPLTRTSEILLAGVLWVGLQVPFLAQAQLSASPILSQPVPAQAGKISYEVVTCTDGDTCRLKSPDNVTLRIRLVGIDAPEVKKRKKTDPGGQPFGEQSKQYINGLIKGRQVTLVSYGSDAYNRGLAEILVGNTNVNLELVRAGLAEVYRGKPPKGLDLSAYEQAQAQARLEKKGIWSLGDKYESPQAYRKSNRAR